MIHTTHHRQMNRTLIFKCMITRLLLAFTVAATSLPVHAQQTSSARGASPSAVLHKMNILFIAVDDLRPEGGAYGSTVVRTPHIAALAKRGIVFERAYCQQAVCSPSRTSLMTGRRPDTTRIYDLQTHFRLTLPNVVTLPQLFKQHGYHTQALSKIYHGGLDDPQSWSVSHWAPKGGEYRHPETLAKMKEEQARRRAEGKGEPIDVLQRDEKTGTTLKVTQPKYQVRGPSWEAPDVPDNDLPDGKTADKAIETLRTVKDRPFFLAVGFLKPHLPFVAPKRYYDMYPPDKIKLAANSFPPKDVPQIALHNSGELRFYSDIPKGDTPIPEARTRELVRGYYAATSYTDAQIGRVIAELQRLGLRERTIIVLWGDHGWHLGEHAMWNKHSNFEVATRSPLIISVPGQKRAGIRTKALVEFVDIYPTLAELARLPLPPDLEGMSLVPVIEKPNRPWKRAAFSQYPRGGGVMGYSMRTDRYRYTEWIKLSTRERIATELYDHMTDPEENVNIANEPENKNLVTRLSKQLSDGWRQALPEGGSVSKGR